MGKKGAILGIFCAAAVMLAGCSQKPQEKTAEPVRVWGPVSEASDTALCINNQNNQFSAGDMILDLSEETRILDAASGMPLSIKVVEDGETIYAYIGETMTASLPPQTTARLVLAHIQENSKVPDYIEVKSMEKEDGGYRLTSTDGLVFNVPSDTLINPYLTRNMLYLEDIYEGAHCLVWSDDSNQAVQILMFPPYGPEEASETSVES